MSSPAAERRVSSLELFFDLVFVFTLTQLTALLATDLGGEGLLRIALIFIVLFWMYGAYAWATNQVPPDRPLRQLLLVAGMAAFLVCALAIPDSFGDAGVAFGIGYLLVVTVHAALYLQVHGRAVLAFAPFNVAFAAVVIVAGFLDPPWSYLLWLAVVVLQVVPSLFSMLSGQLDVNPLHFVERHGLLLIVAFGESVIAIGIAIDHAHLDASTIAAAVLALALAAAMWSLYFLGDADDAEARLTEAAPQVRVRGALAGYFYAFIPMLLGVIVLAAGIKKSLGHFTDELDGPVAATVSGGVALYLVGELAFRRLLGLGPIGLRAIAVLIAVATVAIGLYVSAAMQLIALVVLVVLVAGSDAWAKVRTA